MEGSDVLLAIAEVSIALAGFTSVVAVLGKRSYGDWSPEDTMKLWLMLEYSFATLFLALIPFVPHSLGLPGSPTWIVSSSVMALFLIGHQLVAGPRILRLARQGRWVTRWQQVAVVSLIGSALVIQLLNVSGFGFHHSFGAYFLGLLLVLALAALNFVSLLASLRASGDSS